MRTIILLSVPLFLALYAIAQAPRLQAENSFGGSDVDHAFDIHEISDAGFIMAGHTESNDGNVNGNHGNGTFDFWVVKLGKRGNIQWQKALGGRLDETAFSVQQTSDGGYIVAGQANSSDGQVVGHHGDLDFWIVKLDIAGNIVWSRSLGGTKSDFATCIKQTTDGGYVVCGGSYSNDGDVSAHHGSLLAADYWIVKLDATGNKQWQKSYGGSRGDIAMSIVQSTDGGYVVAGNTTSNDGNVTGLRDSIYGDYWIIKLDRQGNLRWQKTYGGSDYDEATSIQKTQEGGYITCGWSRSPNNGNVTGNHGDYDFWIVKLDSTGNLKWQKSLGGSAADIAYSIEQTTDNGYIVAGGTNSTDGDVSGLHGTEGKDDFWVVKLDARGSLQWQKTLGGSEFEEGRSVDQTKDGGYIVAGFSGWDHPDNGDVTGNHGNYDCWVAKLASPFVAAASEGWMSSVSASQDLFGYVISPDPAHDHLNVILNNEQKNVVINVFNGSGKIVIQKEVAGASKRITVRIDISKLSPGVYYLQVPGTKNANSKKFIKE
jgi:hypothetical protein